MGGMSAKVWRRASSQRHAKIWRLWRKTTRRLESRQPRARAKKKAMETSSRSCIRVHGHAVLFAMYALSMPTSHSIGDVRERNTLFNGGVLSSVASGLSSQRLHLCQNCDTGRDVLCMSFTWTEWSFALAPIMLI